MILAFIEDGTIELHQSAALAAQAYEGVDVESNVVTLDHLASQGAIVDKPAEGT